MCGKELHASTGLLLGPAKTIYALQIIVCVISRIAYSVKRFLICLTTLSLLNADPVRILRLSVSSFESLLLAVDILSKPNGRTRIPSVILKYLTFFTNIMEPSLSSFNVHIATICPFRYPTTMFFHTNTNRK